MFEAFEADNECERRMLDLGMANRLIKFKAEHPVFLTDVN